MKTKSFKKSYRLKKKKSIAISKNSFFWLILLVIGLAILLYLFVFNSFFQIENIQVNGNERVPVEEIKKIVDKEANKELFFISTKSIFLLKTNKVEKDILKELPEVSKISLKKEFPRDIKVEIEERKPVAIFCPDQDCFYLDRQGIIFSLIRKEEIEKEMLEIKSLTSQKESGQQAIENSQLEKILKIESKIKELLPITIAEIVSEQRLNITTSQGWQIYFALEKDIDWQLTELKVILEEIPSNKREKLEYIDLRFDTVYIFPDFSQLR